MSELKVIDLGDIREAIENNHSVYYEYYAKSEADKVIAELEENHKKEVGQLLASNREQAVNANWLRESMKQVIRRQKYKRCIALAKWCKYWANYWECCEPPDCSLFITKAKYYRKWLNRWIKIAEQFKEDK